MQFLLVIMSIIINQLSIIANAGKSYTVTLLCSFRDPYNAEVTKLFTARLVNTLNTPYSEAKKTARRRFRSMKDYANRSEEVKGTSRKAAIKSNVSIYCNATLNQHKLSTCDVQPQYTGGITHNSWRTFLQECQLALKQIYATQNLVFYLRQTKMAL